MRADSKAALASMQQRILARVKPSERKNLDRFFTNVRLFIKHMSGEKLTQQEEDFPVHPLFPYKLLARDKTSAASLIKRLKIIDQYQIDNSHNIINLLSWNTKIQKKNRITARKAHLLNELYENPQLRKYQIAKRLRTTSRVVTKELNELNRDFAFQIYTSLDPHKFRLNHSMILFRTKSVNHSARLEEFLAEQRGFLQAFQLDWDYRHGMIAYRFPDQREGHKMFEQRVRWLHDEFFDISYVVRVDGHYYYMSFSNYDPDQNAFLLEADVVSEVLLQFVKKHRSTIPSPKGFTFSDSIEFDRADFLLALVLFSTGPFEKIEYRRNLLKQYQINLSPKTIWKREQQLRKALVAFPIVDLQIPGLDEQNVITIWCAPETSQTLMALPSILPYAFMYTTNTGLMLFFQRPAFGSTITSQLIRALQKETDIIDLQLYRYQWQFSPLPIFDIVDRWDANQQSWVLQEGDI